MYHILDKAWRIYYKNIIVHIFFSILFLALPYAMYLLSKAQVGYVTSAAVIFLLSVAEVFFGFFPFYVSVAKERITLLWKKLLRPAALLPFVLAFLHDAVIRAYSNPVIPPELTTALAVLFSSSYLPIVFYVVCWGEKSRDLNL